MYSGEQAGMCSLGGRGGGHEQKKLFTKWTENWLQNFGTVRVETIGFWAHRRKKIGIKWKFSFKKTGGSEFYIIFGIFFLSKLKNLQHGRWSGRGVGGWGWGVDETTIRWIFFQKNCENINLTLTKKKIRRHVHCTVWTLHQMAGWNKKFGNISAFRRMKNGRRNWNFFFLLKKNLN